MMVVVMVMVTIKVMVVQGSKFPGAQGHMHLNFAVGP